MALKNLDMIYEFIETNGASKDALIAKKLLDNLIINYPDVYIIQPDERDTLLRIIRKYTEELSYKNSLNSKLRAYIKNTNGK